MKRWACHVAFLALVSACSSSGSGDSGRSGDGGVIANGGSSGAGSPRTGGGGSSNGGGSAVDARSVPNPTKPMCPGAVATPTLVSCNSNADCMVGWQCAFDNTHLTCNLGCAGPMDECSTSAPCPSGKVCFSGPPPGSCSCGGGSRCIPKCVTASDCTSGSACGADGSCKPIACDAGFTCASGQKCDLKGAGADVHGCRTLRCDEPGGAPCTENLVCTPGQGCSTKQCKTGADCDCGACSPELVGGVRQCVSRTGFCAQSF